MNVGTKPEEPGHVKTTPLARAPLSATVALEIERQIIENGLTAGASLPTEVQLMAQFGVSRTVIREAARTLVQKGLVDVRPGRGMTVAPVSVEQFAQQLTLLLRTGHADLDQLFELRELLEPAIASAAARSRTTAHLEEMAETLAVPEHAPAESFLLADLEFHTALARASGNPFFLLVTTPLQILLHDTYEHALRYVAYTKQTRDEHREIYRAVESKNARAAATATRAHLRRARASLSELIEDELLAARDVPNA
jgi:DNA-binding FadR family transcriptional regulator